SRGARPRFLSNAERGRVGPCARSIRDSCTAREQLECCSARMSRSASSPHSSSWRRRLCSRGWSHAPSTVPRSGMCRPTACYSPSRLDSGRSSVGASRSPVGRYTEQRTRARWRALAVLSTHFLDIVRGLPTLRAYNRGRAQTASIAEASERYRQTTMKTLRVAFLSGAVLELAATLGIALVAVTVGVQLVDGDIGLQTGMTLLVLAPELYLPPRNLAAQYHARADGVAVAERLLELLEAPRPS